MPRVTFTDPQAAAVGAAEDRFGATVRLSDVAETSVHTRAESNGDLTLLSDGERLTGAHAIVPEAGEWLRFSEIHPGAFKALDREVAAVAS